jgi:hypothetical protein
LKHDLQKNLEEKNVAVFAKKFSLLFDDKEEENCFKFYFDEVSLLVKIEKVRPTSHSMSLLTAGEEATFHVEVGTSGQDST